MAPAAPAPEAPAPGVVDVEPGADDVAPPDAVAPALPGLAVLALDPPEPMRALVSMNGPLLERVLLAAAPVVPLVPVAPAVLLPPERQPVTVIARLLLDV